MVQQETISDRQTSDNGQIIIFAAIHFKMMEEEINEIRGTLVHISVVADIVFSHLHYS